MNYIFVKSPSCLITLSNRSSTDEMNFYCSLINILPGTKKCFSEIVFQIELLIFCIHLPFDDASKVFDRIDFWWNFNRKPNVQILGRNDIGILVACQDALSNIKSRYFSRWGLIVIPRLEIKILTAMSVQLTSFSNAKESPTTLCYAFPQHIATTTLLMAQLASWISRSVQPPSRKTIRSVWKTHIKYLAVLHKQNEQRVKHLRFCGVT